MRNCELDAFVDALVEKRWKRLLTCAIIKRRVWYIIGSRIWLLLKLDYRCLRILLLICSSDSTADERDKIKVEKNVTNPSEGNNKIIEIMLLGFSDKAGIKKKYTEL